MIIDLITHNLYGVVGKNVVVRIFCGVEKYDMVWQLISIVEGTLLQS